ncbi:MAG TPA: tRNA uridine-5-carboxymethylaminomethyl(34) synthesis GTPase MnmE [Bacteroidia bacterium]|nr:tRNA uridine-5-carboxymethylaminomethyl(34) synthesis GTPase MnmE [Bacteroidia bacterium]
MTLPFNTTDTIVALATPAGTGAIAVIRLSGNNAFDIADRIFRSKKERHNKVSSFNSQTIHFGNIVDVRQRTDSPGRDEKTIDEVLLSVFRSPNSYTGEDIVEISCHGSTFIQQTILQIALKQGARLAREGEFTLRAFLNGKMDLSQAEAVADIVSSDSEGALNLAMNQMRGGYSADIKKMREELIHLASLIELELDFAEEDVEFANREQLKKLVQSLKFKVQSLIDSFALGNAIKQGIPVVIAGKPNVGKSTLLNVLLNEERAIVSPIAGTTRDTVEEEIVLSGIKFRLIDTAGIRQTTDTIENLGVSRTMEKINRSPVLIYLFDVNETSPVMLKEEIKMLKKKSGENNFKIILAGNKSDMASEEKLSLEFNGSGVLFISAKHKTKIADLKEKLLRTVERGEKLQNNFIVTNARHVSAFQGARQSLENVLAGLEKKLSGDLLAPDLRNALNYLGEVTGEVTTDDLLHNIFSKFCIGK